MFACDALDVHGLKAEETISWILYSVTSFLLFEGVLLSMVLKPARTTLRALSARATQQMIRVEFYMCTVHCLSDAVNAEQEPPRSVTSSDLPIKPTSFQRVATDSPLSRSSVTFYYSGD